MWNKILLVPIYLVIFSSIDDDGLVRWRSTGSTASVFGDSCVGVMMLAAVHGEAREEVVRFRWTGMMVWLPLLPVSAGMARSRPGFARGVSPGDVC